MRPYTPTTANQFGTLADLQAATVSRTNELLAVRYVGQTALPPASRTAHQWRRGLATPQALTPTQAKKTYTDIDQMYTAYRAENRPPHHWYANYGLKGFTMARVTTAPHWAHVNADIDQPLLWATRHIAIAALQRYMACILWNGISRTALTRHGLAPILLETLTDAPDLDNTTGIPTPLITTMAATARDLLDHIEHGRITPPQNQHPQQLANRLTALQLALPPLHAYKGADPLAAIAVNPINPPTHPPYQWWKIANQTTGHKLPHPLDHDGKKITPPKTNAIKLAHEISPEPNTKTPPLKTPRQPRPEHTRKIIPPAPPATPDAAALAARDVATASAMLSDTTDVWSRQGGRWILTRTYSSSPAVAVGYLKAQATVDFLLTIMRYGAICSPPLVRYLPSARAVRVEADIVPPKK